jgi:hypothetical protein
LNANNIECSFIEEIGEFNKSRAEYLADALTRISLPNLSKLEQMKLVALMDTLVEVHIFFDARFHLLSNR